MFAGETEVYESYFGGKRRGKRGRGPAGKMPVFGLLKRGAKVYTKIIPDAKSATLIPITTRKVVPASIVYSRSWRGYNAQDVPNVHHFRINHSKLSVDRHNHINGIENFWNPARCHMRRFNRVSQFQVELYIQGI